MKIQFLVIIEQLSDAYRALEVVITIYGLLRMTRNDLTLNYLDFFTNFDVDEQNFLVQTFTLAFEKMSTKMRKILALFMFTSNF